MSNRGSGPGGCPVGLLMAAACTLALLGSAAPAQAWKYHEHMRIGEQSYRCACAWLQELVSCAGGGACEQSPEREVCGPPPAVDTIELDPVAVEIIEKVTCRQWEVKAHTYGQSTALAGDHINAPEDFRDIEGQRDTVSLVEYARRALRDGNHFHPLAPKNWQDYHAQALGRAEKALQALGARQVQAPDEQLEKHLIETLYITAFGDHFLQDSFAAGHMGFNRGGTRPTAAMTYHDRHNRNGRWIRDGRGQIALTHGDGSLHWKFDAKPWLLYAASASVFDVLLTFATGTRHPEVERAASERIPIAYAQRRKDEGPRLDRTASNTTVRNADGRGEIDWVPLAAMHDAASVAYAPAIEYRHAVALAGGDYERDQLALVVSVPWGTTYGIRADFAGGLNVPPLRGDPTTSLYLRAGLTLPMYAAYGSALSFDLGLGGENETRLAGTRSADTIDERGLAGGYLSLKLNLEAGAVVILQAFAHGFLALDYGGSGLSGIAFGFAIGKGTSAGELGEFGGPPI